MPPAQGGLRRTAGGMRDPQRWAHIVHTYIACDVCPDSIRSDGRCDVIYVRNARYGILAPVGVTKLWGRTLDLILHLQSLPIFEVNPNAWGQCGPGFAYCGSGFAQCGFGFVG